MLGEERRRGGEGRNKFEEDERSWRKWNKKGEKERQRERERAREGERERAQQQQRNLKGEGSTLLVHIDRADYHQTISKTEGIFIQEEGPRWNFDDAKFGKRATCWIGGGSGFMPQSLTGGKEKIQWKIPAWSVPPGRGGEKRERERERERERDERRDMWLPCCAKTERGQRHEQTADTRHKQKKIITHTHSHSHRHTHSHTHTHTHIQTRRKPEGKDWDGFIAWQAFASVTKFFVFPLWLCKKKKKQNKNVIVPLIALLAHLCDLLRSWYAKTKLPTPATTPQPTTVLFTPPFPSGANANLALMYGNSTMPSISSW